MDNFSILKVLYNFLHNIYHYLFLFEGCHFLFSSKQIKKTLPVFLLSLLSVITQDEKLASNCTDDKHQKDTLQIFAVVPGP